MAKSFVFKARLKAITVSETTSPIVYSLNLLQREETDKFWHALSLSLRYNGHISRWIWVSRYQNVSILDFIGAEDDGGGEC